jgi:hypothetical protein
MKMRFLILIAAIIAVLIAVGSSGTPPQIDKETAAANAAADTDPVAFAIREIDKNKATATGHVDGYKLYITFSLDPVITLWTATYGFHRTVKRIVPKVFAQFPQINSVTISGKATFHDIRGNDSVDNAFIVSFMRESSSTIKWDNIDPDNILRLAGAYWSNPGIKG